MKRFHKRYLAGVLEARGCISLDPLVVSLRMKGPIPKFLHKQFGGTLYMHLGKPFFRVVGKSAFQLLSDFEPFLVLEQNRVRRYLRKQLKQRDFGNGP